jgi:hypothetical protein
VEGAGAAADPALVGEGHPGGGQGGLHLGQWPEPERVGHGWVTHHGVGVACRVAVTVRVLHDRYTGRVGAARIVAAFGVLRTQYRARPVRPPNPAETGRSILRSASDGVDVPLVRTPTSIAAEYGRLIGH